MPHRILAAALVFAPAPAAAAADVVVVAPDSPMAPYQEALQGVCDALGSCPPVLKAGARTAVPEDAKVVIALGGRAARRRYPARVALVTALTPGYDARADEPGAVVRVRLTFSPEVSAARLKRKLKPGARRAVLLWSEEDSGRFAERVRDAAAPLGLEVQPVEVLDAEDLPALLRGLPASDAVWLAPDPSLVTPTTFEAAREYAESRGVAFFAPAPGLAERGGDPSLAPSFRAAGLRAGAAARGFLQERDAPRETYPDESPADASGSSLLVSTRPLSAPR